MKVLFPNESLRRAQYDVNQLLIIESDEILYENPTKSYRKHKGCGTRAIIIRSGYWHSLGDPFCTRMSVLSSSRRASSVRLDWSDMRRARREKEEGRTRKEQGQKES